jgi:glycosyltransferase involved in cell wall biosynthesis
MKILHLSHNDILNDTRTIKQIVAAIESRIDVQAVCIKLNKKIAYTKAIDHKLVTSLVLYSRKLKIPSLIRHALVFFELSIRFYLIGYKKVGKNDLIHCSDVVSLPASLLIKFHTGAKILYDAHELESQKNGNSKLESFLIYQFEKLSWKFIDSFVTVSESIENWYLKRLGSKKSAVIYNSPSLTKRNTTDRNSFYLKEKFSTGQNIIFLYVGIIGRGRGVELMLDVFSRSHRKSHLVFLGYGSLEELVQKKVDVSQNIHMHFGVAQEDMQTVVSSADFGLCIIEPCSLSDIYALPNKLFEYCFFGLPVIGSNLPDISNLINKYQLGYVTEPNPEHLEKVVSQIENNYHQDAKFSEFRSLSKLSWSYQSEKLIKLYSIS